MSVGMLEPRPMRAVAALMNQSPTKKSKPKAPRGRGGKAANRDMNQATTDDFEREDMGIAPKE